MANTDDTNKEKRELSPEEMQDVQGGRGNTRPKESGEKSGTSDMNIGIGELQE